MSVFLTLVVKAYTVIDAVRLGLRFKAKGTVQHALDSALEVGLAAKEVADIELYARLWLPPSALARSPMSMSVRETLPRRQ